MRTLSTLRICLLLLLVSLWGVSLGQNELDAFRYSGTTSLGTSRSNAMGGAFSAVGADFSSTYSNPAGLGVYRRSELMFTPTLRTTGNESLYLNSTNDASRSAFTLGNFGYVYNTSVMKYNPESQRREPAKSGLTGFSFAIGYNQIDNFNRRTEFDVYNDANSMTDYFAGLASGESIGTIFNSQTIPSMAAAGWLIDTFAVDGNWIGAANGGDVQQTYAQEERGRTNEWNIGFAGNVNDKLYAGASIGIVGMRYNSEFIYTEQDVNNVHRVWAADSTPFNQLTYSDIYQVRGSGVNLKLGIIARPVDFLRVGVSFQSPTWNSMTDEYSTQILGNLDADPNDYGYSDDPLVGAFDYNFVSPYRLTIGAMALIGKYGFLSADFDYLDYRSARYSSDVSPASSFYYSFANENQAIAEIFSTAYNYRFGGEFRLGPGRFRLGYANYGAIVRDEFLQYVDYETGNLSDIDGSRRIFSGGIGLKQKNYYIDVAYMREYASERRLFYNVQNPFAYSPELINQLITNIYSMTIGFTF